MILVNLGFFFFFLFIQTSVTLAFVQQEPTKELEKEKILQESDSLDGAHAKKFEFDECFYDQSSMVHD